MKGTLQTIEEKQKRDGSSFYQLGINGASYSLFDEKLLQGIQEGDAVNFTYFKNGKYSNIKSLEKFTAPQNGGNGSANRYSPEGIKLSCLRSATELLSDSKMDAEKKVNYVLEAAKRFEEYATGKEEDEPITDL